MELSTLLGDFVYSIHFFFHREALDKIIVFVYNKVRNYSFAQGATSFALTAAKDIGIYYASAKVASVVGGFVVGSKFGALLGVWAGPVGMILGASAGFVIGYFIDSVGDAIINWVMNLFD